ncbi:putative hydrolase of the HAD superfamily [Chitinophaga costaii]|uniref:Putative hydrolase of the HAD superfamily n=1 Tax=Chitinophaga costaii TaxID=1335309 RepID=A0A1C4APH5_9BACT|nr:HAD family hydrolase [Chitinophaga costaii]PUZ26690.1 HAD family hydrolase [Chitinophaga costaii]SCB96437.1 putative hydrolase of the HAD superfamily [Chitinophaga costaii]
MTGLKHISFDLWYTIIKSDPDYKPKRNQLFADMFGITRSIDEINTQFKYFDVLINVINEKTGGQATFYEIYYYLLAALGVDIRQVEPAQLDAYYTASEKLFFEHPPVLMDPQTPALFQELRNLGYTISLLSNTAFIRGSTLRQLMPDWGLETFFDFQLYSDEEGTSKPSYQFYQLMFDRVNQLYPATKDQILHVGDNPVADVGGGDQFGIKTLWLPPGTTLTTLLKPAVCSPVLPNTI